MKKYNRLLVVLGMILLSFLLSWILPRTVISGEFVNQGRFQIGLIDLFANPVFTFYNFIYVLLYLIIVAGFYHVLKKVPAYKILLNKIVKCANKRKLFSLILVVFILAGFVSITGFVYEMLLFVPFICAIVLMMGYDKITCALTTVGSVCVGIIGSTISKPIMGALNTVVSCEYSDLLLAKVILLLVGVAVLVGYIVFYNKKNPKEKVESEVMDIFVPSNSIDSKRKKVWPLVLILSLLTFIFFMGSIDWNGVFGIDIFEKIALKIIEFKIGDFEIFGKLLGSAFVPFGNFEVHTYLMIVVFSMITIKFVYGIKMVDILDTFEEGFKNILPVGLLIMLSYTVLIIMSNSSSVITMMRPLLELTEGLNTITLSIATFVGALFNSDFAFYNYHAFTLSYVTTFINDTTLYGLCTLITSSMYGIAMLIAPTSVVLLYTLSTLKISYFKWLKKVLYLLLILFAVSIIAFTILLRFFV